MIQELLAKLEIVEGSIREKVNNVLSYLASEGFRSSFIEYPKGTNKIDEVLKEVTSKLPREQLESTIEILGSKLGLPTKVMEESLAVHAASCAIILREKYYENPEQAFLTGEELLKMGWSPQRCLGYTTIAHDLLTSTGVEVRMVYMHDGEKFGPPHHSVLEYKNEKGEWERCDPKWERSRNPVFFDKDSLSYEAFRFDRQNIHGSVHDGIEFKRYKNSITVNPAG